MANKVVYLGRGIADNFSQKAINWMKVHGWTGTDINKVERHNPLLVKCVETLGDESGELGGWCVVEIEDNMYTIIKNPDRNWGGEELIKFSQFNWVKI